MFAQYKDYPQIAGKVQPLTLNEFPSWLTLDVDLRGRTEAQTSINYQSGNAQVYELTRARGAMEVRPTKWLTGYVQFHDNHALGLPLKFVASNMRDEFDFRQGYLSFHVKPVQVFAGRQELKFGDERLIGISDWTNNSRTFDGFDARIGDKNRVDLFSAAVVVIHPTALDMHAGGLTFHGAYGSIRTLVPRTTIDPFVFVKALPYVVSQQKTGGTETEVTPGIHISRNAMAGLEYSLEGALNRGSYSNDSIHAGAALIKAAYTARVPWTPRLQGEYDYATGNPHRNAQRISTFDQQYPSSHNAFGLVDLFGWQNMRQERINLNLNPAKHLTVLIQQEFLNVTTKKDGVYSGSGSEFLKPPTGGFLSDDIGRGFDASMKYVYHDYFVVNAGVGHFSPGDLMTANSHGAPLTLSYLSFTYRFRVERSGL
ncbi:MAG TPA: alginate export family protein [Acidobacteriaceae bacterium]|nr:alginate export family protein [Acidobacteriaceae bacterium]